MNFESMTNEAVATELGRRIEQLRLERNITQENMADTIGVTRKTYSKLEKGQCKLETLVAALRVLGQIHQLDQLLPETLFSPLELLKSEGKQRQRARSGKDDPDMDIGW